MSSLFAVEIAARKAARLTLRVTMISPEARAFLVNKQGALWLLVEPVFHGVVPLSAAFPFDADTVARWDPRELRPYASQVVSSVKLIGVEPPVRDHLARLSTLDGPEIDALFADRARCPCATIELRAKDATVLEHHVPGTTWDSVFGDFTT